MVFSSNTYSNRPMLLFCAPRAVCPDSPARIWPCTTASFGCLVLRRVGADPYSFQRPAATLLSAACVDLCGFLCEACPRPEGEESEDQCDKRTTIDRFHNVFSLILLTIVDTRVALPGILGRKVLTDEGRIK